MKWAYFSAGVAQDVVSANPSDLFNPSYAELFEKVPDEVEFGWFKS